MIHNWSPRANAPFIVVSAAMMSPDRVEEELFGSDSRRRAAPRPARAGAWRDPVPRRDRRHAADHPGQDPARADRPEPHPDRRPAPGQGRRARAVGDLAQPVRRDCRGALPRGPLLSPQRRARCASRRCASGARTSPNWSTISSRATPPSAASRRPRCRPRRWPRSRRTTGRAMSASCATSSSAR